MVVLIIVFMMICSSLMACWLIEKHTLGKAETIHIISCVVLIELKITSFAK